MKTKATENRVNNQLSYIPVEWFAGISETDASSSSLKLRHVVRPLMCVATSQVLSSLRVRMYLTSIMKRNTAPANTKKKTPRVLMHGPSCGPKCIKKLGLFVAFGGSFPYMVCRTERRKGAATLVLLVADLDSGRGWSIRLDHHKSAGSCEYKAGTPVLISHEKRKTYMMLPSPRYRPRPSWPNSPTHTPLASGRGP